MKITARESARLTLSMLVVSALMWMMLLFNPGSIMNLSHCPMMDSGASPASLRMLLAMNPVSSLAAGWALMLAAMMLPTLIAPVRHIIERSFKSRRARSAALFLIGYAAVWMAAGVVLTAVMIWLVLLMPQSFLPAIGIGIIAFAWQCSPVKQRCLNRSHNHHELAAFGRAADGDALRFGVMHGIWCAGSCWALMLFPMLLAQGHLAAMAVVTFVMISERLEHPKFPVWRLHFPGKLLRIAAAQTRIRLPKMYSSSKASSAEVNGQ